MIFFYPIQLDPERRIRRVEGEKNLQRGDNGKRP